MSAEQVAALGGARHSQPEQQRQLNQQQQQQQQGFLGSLPAPAVDPAAHAPSSAPFGASQLLSGQAPQQRPGAAMPGERVGAHAESAAQAGGGWPGGAPDLEGRPSLDEWGAAGSQPQGAPHQAGAPRSAPASQQAVPDPVVLPRLHATAAEASAASRAAAASPQRALGAAIAAEAAAINARLLARFNPSAAGPHVAVPVSPTSHARGAALAAEAAAINARVMAQFNISAAGPPVAAAAAASPARTPAAAAQRARSGSADEQGGGPARPGWQSAPASERNLWHVPDEASAARQRAAWKHFDQQAGILFGAQQPNLAAAGAVPAVAGGANAALGAKGGQAGPADAAVDMDLDP